MFDFFKKIIDNNEEKQTATCPKCNGNIIEHGNYWICQNTLSKSCDFKIKNTFNSEKIDIKYLINFKDIEGVSDIFNEIQEKTKEEINIRKLFGSNNVSLLGFNCRKCRVPLYRVDNVIKCPECDFSINAFYKGVIFSQAQMRDLLRRSASEKHEFTEADGSKTEGWVLIPQDDNYMHIPEYIFFQDIDELEEKYKDYSAPYSYDYRYVPIKKWLKKK